MPLPDPQSGLVISYSYLWRRESEAGQEEGVKHRPCAIVLVVKRQDHTKHVTVAPITHTPPHHPANALEIPPNVKRHLGLDSERSWVVLDDFNEFTWPGFDLASLPGQPGRYDYGFLPPAFFQKIISRMLALKQKGEAFSSLRDTQ